MAPETQAPNTEVDIFDVPAENLVGGSGDGEAYKASIGVHQATIVAAVDLGEVEDNFNPGKKKRKAQLLYALNDQTVVFGEEGKADYRDTLEPITIISPPYTLSFNEKSTLRKHALKIMGKEFDEKTTTLGSLVGQKCQLIVSLNEKGYIVADPAAPSKGQMDPEKPVYLPTFWLQDSEGKPTGKRIKTHPTLVIPGVRPKHNANA